MSGCLKIKITLVSELFLVIPQKLMTVHYKKGQYTRYDIYVQRNTYNVKD